MATQTFYRQGVDIYNASNNQKIGATDWAKNWTGRATEVKAPTVPTGGSFQLNPNYNPNDQNVNRYIPAEQSANSTPIAIGLPQNKQSGGVSIVDPFAGKNPTVSVIEPNFGNGKVDIIGNNQPNQNKIAPTPTPTPQNTAPEAQQKQFYRIGQTIFDASTDKAITPDDWAKNWTGRASEIQKGYQAIPDPSKINQFTRYQKIGNTMYGIPVNGGAGAGDMSGADQGVPSAGIPFDTQDQGIRDILTYAGQADLSPEQTLSLLNAYNQVSSDERSKIENDLGIPDVVNSLYTKPSKTSEQIYQEAYNSSELPNLKNQIAEIDKKIAEKKEQITAGTAELQNNPWLSQASRGGRIRNLNETAQSELNNLLDERQGYLDTYNGGVDEIEKVMTRYASQLEEDQTLNASKLNYLLNQAEKQVTALTQSKQAENLRYVPDYLKAKADKNLDKLSYEATKQQLELQKLGLDIDKAKRETGDLPTSVAGRVDKIANQFDGEQTVKNYAQLVESVNMISQIPDDTKNPADNQALIYAFAKAMDPTSVVREGEYATVQKYAQSWLESFGFNAMRVVNNQQFLSQQAVQNIKATIAKKFTGTESSYKNLTNEYGRRIDRITGKADGTDYISNYSGGLMQEDSRPTLDIGQEAGFSDEEIQEAIKQQGESAVRQWLLSKKKMSSASTTGMRTDRHNNPTAFTTDIAKQAGLKEGVDYEVGDPFPNNPNLKTATILGDPIATTIKVIDKIGFQTASGKQRWSYINMPKSQWDGMTYQQKKNTIAKMYTNEGGSQLKQYFA